MNCPKCGTWMVDPRGGSGSWVWGITKDWRPQLIVIAHYDYRCPKCGHLESVDTKKCWVSDKYVWEKQP